MKKRFLPISLLLTIIILAQTGFVVKAKEDSGKYNPRSTSETTAQSFMKSIRANQETGLIDPAWLLESTKGSQTRDGELNWTSLGPDNYGSLTRGIVYDKQDATNKTIYVGTMGGGIFKTTNGGITWKSVGEGNFNLMVSCMIQVGDVIYIGTGDGRGAHSHNGLSHLNYETSFIGTGIYKLQNGTITQIESTSTFVNDMAAYGNKVYAATNDGLKCYENGEWTVTFEGEEVYGVEVCSDGDVVAVVGSDVYIGENKITDGTKLPTGTTYKMVAVAPSDPNYMYVAYLTSSNGTGNIYFTNDHGETWGTAYISSGLYDIFGDRGMLDNAIAVYPNDPKKFLIGGKDLWVIKDESGEGIYRLECISSGSGFQIPQSGGSYYYNYTYIHSGIQSIAFNPNNVNEFFVGSEGGVFKGTCSAAYGYQFEGVNRYMIDAENHTSVTRMFSVGFAGKENTTIGGSLDHGTIHIISDKSVNEEVTEGSAIYPNDISTTNAAETYGAFDYSKAGGPCAISTIYPEAMFVTATGSNTPGTPLLRTQTAGYDYDKDNFSYSVTNSTTAIKNSNAFRTPIALFENYNDTKAVELVKYVNNTGADIPAGEIVTMKSRNFEYPFDYTLTEALAAGDSIEVQDIISSTLLVAVEGKLKMTRDALIFNEVARWWDIPSKNGNANEDAPSISGIPSALTISADGDVAYLGTLEGKLYRVSNLTSAVDEISAVGVAHADAIPDMNGNDSIPEVEGVASVITLEEIDATAFNGQAITSISINPNDNNEVIVTLGNYGNDNYIFHATDGKSFTAKPSPTQGPVYSSLIEKTTGKVFVGTENGVYTSEDMNTWAETAITGVPVMEIKQQIQENHDNRYVYLVDEIGEITTIEYPGIFNEGMIYIATYGRGLFNCDTYLVKNDEISVEESTAPSSLEMNVYPNPIQSEATIYFNVTNKTNVTMQMFDLSGRMVMNKVLGTYDNGSHEAKINVDGLTSGTYIIKVQAGTVSNTSKVLVY